METPVHCEGPWLIDLYCVILKRMCNWVYISNVCTPTWLSDACLGPSSSHPPSALKCFVCFSVFFSFHAHTPVGECRLPFFCLIFNLFFWFLLSALLTCFVSFFPFCFLSAIQYLQMKWPLLDVQPGGLQSRQALKDARSPSPAHIVVSNTQLGTFALLPPSLMTERQKKLCFPSLTHPVYNVCVTFPH